MNLAFVLSPWLSHWMGQYLLLVFMKVVSIPLWLQSQLALTMQQKTKNHCNTLKVYMLMSVRKVSVWQLFVYIPQWSIWVSDFNVWQTFSMPSFYIAGVLGECVDQKQIPLAIWMISENVPRKTFFEEFDKKCGTLWIKKVRLYLSWSTLQDIKVMY